MQQLADSLKRKKLSDEEKFLLAYLTSYLKNLREAIDELDEEASREIGDIFVSLIEKAGDKEEQEIRDKIAAEAKNKKK